MNLVIDVFMRIVIFVLPVLFYGAVIVGWIFPRAGNWMLGLFVRAEGGVAVARPWLNIVSRVWIVLFFLVASWFCLKNVWR